MKFHKIYIEITNACNLNCSFCSNSKRKEKEMTVLEFTHVLKEIGNKTAILLLHVKGEPLLHSQLSPILKLCEEYHKKVHLTTNGTLLKEKVSILKQYSCLEKIAISLHCEQEYPSYFADVFEAVRELPSNCIVIYRLWALPNGCFNKQSTAIVEKLATYYHLSTDVVHKIKNQKNTKIASNYYVDKAGLFSWPNGKGPKKDGTCQGLRSQLAILSDGRVVPCCLDGEGALTLGNIFEEDLDTLLANERSKNIKEQFSKGKAFEPFCQSCRYKERFRKNI